jgi:hypothetical protein
MERIHQPAVLFLLLDCVGFAKVWPVARQDIKHHQRFVRTATNPNPPPLRHTNGSICGCCAAHTQVVGRHKRNIEL